MSTIGLKVQEMPSALASIAAIRADSSMAFISHVHDNPNGMGKIVSYPWITSIPNNKGMPRREFSTANFCTSRIFSTPFKLKSPPTSPRLILPAMSLLFACPVVMSPVTGRLSCPIFSSTVIRFIKASMKRFISCGDFCACMPLTPINVAASRILKVFINLFMVNN